MTSRLDTVKKISHLLDNHCKGCEIKTEYNRKYGGNTSFITTHCSVKCPIGIELAELGGELNSVTRPRKKTKQEAKPMAKPKFNLTEEQFNTQRASGKTVAQIAKEQGVTEVTIYNRITKWADARKPEQEKLLREKNVSAPADPKAELLTTENQNLRDRVEVLKADITVLVSEKDQTETLCKMLEEEKEELEVSRDDYKQAYEVGYAQTTEHLQTINELQDKLKTTDKEWTKQVDKWQDKNMELIKERCDLLEEVNRLTVQVADLKEMLSQQEHIKEVPTSEVQRLDTAIQDLTRARWILGRLTASGE